MSMDVYVVFFYIPLEHLLNAHFAWFGIKSKETLTFTPLFNDKWLLATYFSLQFFLSGLCDSWNSNENTCINKAFKYYRVPTQLIIVEWAHQKLSIWINLTHKNVGLIFLYIYKTSVLSYTFNMYVLKTTGYISRQSVPSVIDLLPWSCSIKFQWNDLPWSSGPLHTSQRACALFHCGSTSAVGECVMAVWMRIVSFTYPFSSFLLRYHYRPRVRRACSVDVYLNKHVFIFSVEHFYSGLTLLLSGLPSAERPGIQPDLTEPVKIP